LGFVGSRRSSAYLLVVWSFQLQGGRRALLFCSFSNITEEVATSVGKGRWFGHRCQRPLAAPASLYCGLLAQATRRQTARRRCTKGVQCRRPRPRDTDIARDGGHVKYSRDKIFLKASIRHSNRGRNIKFLGIGTGKKESAGRSCLMRLVFSTWLAKIVCYRRHGTWLPFCQAKIQIAT